MTLGLCSFSFFKKFTLIFILSLTLVSEQMLWGIEEAKAQTETQNQAATNTGPSYPVDGFSGVEDGMSTALNYMAVLVIAFFGVALPFLCLEGVKAITKTPSMAIFLLGSVIYLVGEVYTTIQYKKLAAEAQTIYLNDSLAKQIDALKTSKTRHEEYYKTLKIKFYLAIAVAVVYVAAGAAAIVETLLKRTLDCSVKGGGVKTANCAPISPFPLTLFFAEAVAADLTSSVPDVQDTLNKSGGSGTSSMLGLNLNLSDMTQTYSIIKFVLLGLGGALGAGLALAFRYTVLGTKIKFQSLISMAATRIILFFACAAMVGVFILIVKKQMSKLQDRIDYLGTVISALEQYSSTSANAGGTVLPDIDPSNGGFIPPITLPPEVADNKNSSGDSACIVTDEKTKALKLDQECVCKKSPQGCDINNVPNASKTSITFPGSMLASIESATSSLKNMASGSMDKALLNLEGVAKQAANMRTIRDQYVDKYQEQLKKEKKAAINFPAEQKKVADQFMNAARASLRKAKLDESKVKSWGDALFAGSDGISDDSKLAKKDPSLREALGQNGETAPAKSGNGLGSDGKNGQDQLRLDDFTLSDTPPENTLPDVSAGEYSDVDQFEFVPVEETSLDDVHKNIFDVVSRRYLKTAYPQFFRISR